MAGDTENIRIWETGDVYVGDVGTPAPTDVESALDAGWEPLGVLHEDGLTEGYDADETEHWTWNAGLGRKTVNHEVHSKKVIALEDTDLVWQLLHPGSTSEESGGITTRTTKRHVNSRKAFLFEKTDGTVISRKVFPNGEAFQDGEVTSNGQDMAGFPLMVVAYEDENGAYEIEVTNDVAAIPLGS